MTPHVRWSVGWSALLFIYRSTCPACYSENIVLVVKDFSSGRYDKTGVHTFTFVIYSEFSKKILRYVF